MNFVRRDIDVAGAVAVRSPERIRSERKWPITYGSVEIIAMVVDAAIIVAASTVAGAIYHYRAFGAPGDIIQYCGSAAVVATLFISLMQSRGMYRPNELLVLRHQIRWVCVYWAAVFALLAGAVFALKIGTELSRGASVAFAIVGACALIAQRTLWVNLLTRGVIKRKFSGRKVILITDHRQAAEFKPASIPDEPGISTGVAIHAASTRTWQQNEAQGNDCKGDRQRTRIRHRGSRRWCRPEGLA